MLGRGALNSMIVVPIDTGRLDQGRCGCEIASVGISTCQGRGGIDIRVHGDQAAVTATQGVWPWKGWYIWRWLAASSGLLLSNSVELFLADFLAFSLCMTRDQGLHATAASRPSASISARAALALKSR